MRATTILRLGIPLLLLALMPVAGCAAPTEVSPAEGEGETQRVVNIKADGLILHYQRQSFWAEAKFCKYLANQDKFKADFKEHFEPELAQSNVSASDYSFSFDSATHSTIIRCDIHNAISLSGGEYQARFEWLKLVELPEGFDLLNCDKISKDTLKGETEINGIPVTVTLVFPVPITGNCHWHVWWTE